MCVCYGWGWGWGYDVQDELKFMEVNQTRDVAVANVSVEVRRRAAKAWTRRSFLWFALSLNHHLLLCCFSNVQVFFALSGLVVFVLRLAVLL